MEGVLLAGVVEGIRTLAENLMNYPLMREMAYISLITFASSATQDVVLTELPQFDCPPLTGGGTAALGSALEILGEAIEAEVIRQDLKCGIKGDHRPFVLIVTNGSPDLGWERGFQRLQGVRPRPEVYAIACGEHAPFKVLEDIVGKGMHAHDKDKRIYKMAALAPEDFKTAFKLITQTIVEPQWGCEFKPER